MPEPGEWRHGWQYYACAQLEKHFRESVVLAGMDETRSALLRSQSGCCSGRHLTLVPRSAESTYTPERFRVLTLGRFRVPLGLTCQTCNGRTCRQ
eukprot:12401294-Karenia_brevis.AAC.1